MVLAARYGMRRRRTRWRRASISYSNPAYTRLREPKNARDSAITTDRSVPINEMASVSQAPSRASATTFPERSGGNSRPTYSAMAPPPSALNSIPRSISDPW